MPSPEILVGGAVLGGIQLGVIMHFWTALSLRKLLPKLGCRPSVAWIPVVNMVELLGLGGLTGLPLALSLVPVVGWPMTVVALAQVGAQCGAPRRLAPVGLLLLPVWASLLSREIVHAPDLGHRLEGILGYDAGLVESESRSTRRARVSESLAPPVPARRLRPATLEPLFPNTAPPSRTTGRIG